MASTDGVAPPSNDGGNPGNPGPGSPSRQRGDGHRGRGRGGRGGGGGGRGRGRGDGHGHRGGAARGRGRGGNANANNRSTATEPANESNKNPNPSQAGKPPVFKTQNQAQDDADDDDAEVCFICANPMTHKAVAPCNHTTCHICSLRLRALYKNKDCPHCRTAAPFVIFTDDATKRFEEYANSDITSTDDNIGIRYAGEDIVGDTILLLRYNCPDSDCDFAGLGWPDLHRHVRAVHHKKMCDLCTRNKKVFTHEHEMFTDKGLGEHMRHGDDKPGAVDQTGFKGHPLCGFCGERFYDDDKLYEHCRNKHERCFICDRRDSRQPHYFMDYNALEEHFKKDHFLCLDRECLEKKFVVFESELDLKAHQLSEHANSLSKDVRRDARLVDMSGFDFRPSYQQERRGGHGGGGGGSSRENRGRGRDPNAEALPVSSAQPLRRDELAFQRQMAISSGQQASAGPSRTPNPTPAAATRPGANTRPSRAPASSQPTPQPPIDSLQSMSINDLSSLTPEQRARLIRHGAVIERASNLLGSDTAKMSTFRTYISNYNKGSMTSEQLIDAFFALFTETSSNALGTLVREVADLFEDKKRGEAVLRAWQDWRAINEDYPSLPGLGGMHGATTSSSGWAAAAAASPTTTARDAVAAANTAAQSRHTTRVLKLKNSTRRGSGSGLGSGVMSIPASVPGSSDWVTSRSSAVTSSSSAPPSSAAFPALPSGSRSGSGSGSSTPRAAPQPSWIGGTGNSSRTTSTTTAATRTAPARGGASGPVRKTEEAFPSLPSAPKPMTTIFGHGGGRGVRRDLGGFGSNNSNNNFSWGTGGQGSSSTAAANNDGGEDDGAAGGKGKKKKKQVLVQWG